MAAKLTVLDILATIAAAIRILIVDIPLFALSLASASSPRSPASYELPMPELLKLFLIRRMNVLFPVRTIRKLTDAGLPSTVLTSTRYGPFAPNIFSPVTVTTSSFPFRGRWIIRSSLSEPSPPHTSDITILYLHGGGYVSSSPASYLLFLLRLAETIIQSGKSISIFAPEYDLAPENRYPHQLHQAGAAYTWLLDDVGIKRDKLIIMGDSAGGHLALSLLVNLHTLRDSKESESRGERPCLGLVLLSPWLSLHHIPDSFTRNEMTDVLTGPFLYQTARRFLGPHAQWGSCEQRLEFLTPEGEPAWDTILPDWVWVSAGKNEILYDDIIRWIVERGADCAGRSRINGEIDRDMPHVYAWLETVDPVVRKQFLSKEIREYEFAEFQAIDRLGKAVVERI